VDADEKDAKRKSFFEYQRMVFYDTPINETRSYSDHLTELRLFIAELKNQNHWCFQQKSTAISKSNGVDDKYSSSINASNKSRISIDYCSCLDLYIHLDKSQMTGGGIHCRNQ
jgi:hypothetical protein